MIGWRDQVLRQFPPGGARLCIAADREGLLEEVDLKSSLSGNGYRSIVYDDPVEFRFRYEADREGRRLIIRTTSDPRLLPYDLVSDATLVDVSLESLFPGLNAGVVSVIERGDLDRLYQACRREQPDCRSESASWDFVLEQLLGVRLASVRGSVELLRLLLVCHDPGTNAPRTLRNYLLRRLRERPQFREWPLEVILFDRELFHSFVRERYAAHQRERGSQSRAAAGVREGPRPVLLRFAAPLYLPLGHPRIRPHIRALLGRGVLQYPTR
ncbi:MAG TPA: hypothetical protein VFI91_07475 [Longimicrobiaceae bacterium]|nr:hypothetical protein [Longimicrobiaceae bacterium]